MSFSHIHFKTQTLRAGQWLSLHSETDPPACVYLILEVVTCKLLCFPVSFYIRRSDDSDQNFSTLCPHGGQITNTSLTLTMCVDFVEAPKNNQENKGLALS